MKQESTHHKKGEPKKITKVKEIEILSSKRKINFKTNSRNYSFDCEIGKKGFSEEGEGVEGDKKTPLGKFKVLFVRLPKENQEEVFTITMKPKRSLGPAFICIDSYYKGKLRGIGIHGTPKKEKELKPTEGCIRMENKPLSFFKDKITPGTRVSIICDKI